MTGSTRFETKSTTDEEHTIEGVTTATKGTEGDLAQETVIEQRLDAMYVPIMCPAAAPIVVASIVQEHHRLTVEDTEAAHRAKGETRVTRGAEATMNGCCAFALTAFFQGIESEPVLCLSDSQPISKSDCPRKVKTLTRSCWLSDFGTGRIRNICQE